MDSTNTPTWLKEIRVYWKQLTQERTTTECSKEIRRTESRADANLCLQKPSLTGYHYTEQVLQESV